jgi:antitoxin component YwqK of YwqJK toxin-antitoxin module
MLFHAGFFIRKYIMKVITEKNNSTGDITKASCLEDGKYDGKYEVFFANGQLKTTGTYQTDRQQGTFKYYDPKGKLVCEIVYENGIEKVRVKFEYTSKGKIKEEKSFINGKFSKQQTYFETGKLKSVTDLSKTIEYYEDGSEPNIKILSDKHKVKLTRKDFFL